MAANDWVHRDHMTYDPDAVQYELAKQRDEAMTQLSDAQEEIVRLKEMLRAISEAAAIEIYIGFTPAELKQLAAELERLTLNYEFADARRAMKRIVTRAGLEDVA